MENIPIASRRNKIVFFFLVYLSTALANRARRSLARSATTQLNIWCLNGKILNHHGISPYGSIKPYYGQIINEAFLYSANTWESPIYLSGYVESTEKSWIGMICLIVILLI